MADFKGRKSGKSHVQNTGIFLVAQDMVFFFFLVAQDKNIVLSHRAEFHFIMNFFRVKAIFTWLIEDIFLWSKTFVKISGTCTYIAPTVCFAVFIYWCRRHYFNFIKYVLLI